MYIAMRSPSNAPQTIVTLPQIKDILATTTVTTIVKLKTGETTHDIYIYIYIYNGLKQMGLISLHGDLKS